MVYRVLRFYISFTVDFNRGRLECRDVRWDTCLRWHSESRIGYCDSIFYHPRYCRKLYPCNMKYISRLQFRIHFKERMACLPFSLHSTSRGMVVSRSFYLQLQEKMVVSRSFYLQLQEKMFASPFLYLQLQEGMVVSPLPFTFNFKKGGLPPLPFFTFNFKKEWLPTLYLH